jgi:ATP-dependent Clp protease adaptor protein ClpS
MGQHQSDSDIALFPKHATDVREPSMYRVMLLNDDYTTMEFVVEILVKVFHKHYDEAARIMLHVHKKGSGLCGIYPFEVAESKVHTVHNLARENGFPLKCTMEKE